VWCKSCGATAGCGVCRTPDACKFAERCIEGRHIAHPVEPPPGRFAWLIERKAEPRYLAAYPRLREFIWMTDHNEAMAFATREQADGAMMAIRELVPALFPVDIECRPVEHGWAAGAPSAVPGEPPCREPLLCACRNPSATGHHQREKCILLEHGPQQTTTVAAPQPVSFHIRGGVAPRVAVMVKCWSDTGHCVNHGACNLNDGCMYEPRASPLPGGREPKP
jgi:hypothetical protein